MRLPDSLETLAIRVWTTLPNGVRLRLRQRRLATSAKRLLRRWKWRNLPFDAVYDDTYFQHVETSSGPGADVMAGSIIKYLSPLSVVDVGCGTGVLLHALRLRGVEVKGIEHAPAALRVCRARELHVDDVDLTDANQREQCQTYADVAICLEVAHQLPASSADGLIEMLCRLSNTILFSAPADVEDRRPLNSRPHSYWIEQFRHRGYISDEELTTQLRSEWRQQQTAEWFHSNVLVLHRAT